MQPRRPNFAPGYGISQEVGSLLPWSHATDRLAASRNYWLATTRPDGRPHVAPVWGVWLDGALYFGTDRASVKARNLASNPTLVVHLESGDDVVILEGTPEIVASPASIPGLNDAYKAKYGMAATEAGGDDAESAALWYVFRPNTASAWLESDFVNTATRWDR
jgi:hypothetical protein